MAKHKVIDLINQFMEDHGQSSGKDRVMLWFEDVYSKIRRLPWSWNFTVTDTQTGGDRLSTPVITSVDATETFSWTQGNDYIQSTVSTISCVTGYHTGRYVYIDDEWYRCIRISPDGNKNRVYLDKKIVSASASTQTVSFYRRDLAFKTNGIKSMHVDDRKLENLTSEQIYRFKRGLDPRWYYGDSGEPLAYHVHDFEITPPGKAPLVTLSEDATVTGITAGVHRVFFTFIDAETGQESAPGPAVEFTATSLLNKASIAYDSDGDETADDWHDESTYLLGIYMSTAIGEYTRVPMWSAGATSGLYYAGTEGGTGAITVTTTKSDAALRGRESYYDGEWTATCFYPAPDEYLRAHARHIDTWQGLPEEDYLVKLGRQREFIDLFHLYFLMKQSIQNKDPAQFRQMQGSFREQLNFLLAQDGDDRRLDPSSWEYKFYSPMISSSDDFTSSLKYPF